MQDRQIKAYGFNGTLEFIEKTYDAAAKGRILESVSPAVREFMKGSKKAQWAPPLHSCELWGGIVREHADPTEARAQLVKTGRHMGSFATNTYLKLLMKMLTVKMFAKKFPDLWGRDANFGKVTLGDLAELEHGRMQIHFDDLGSYPYFGPICEGWFAFSLETMGLKGLKVEVQDWSLENPDPGSLRYHITWTP